MSHIDNTRRNLSCPIEITVCLTRRMYILLPFFRKAYNTVKDRYEKYEDIHNGGEATERIGMSQYDWRRVNARNSVYPRW